MTATQRPSLPLAVRPALSAVRAWSDLSIAIVLTGASAGSLAAAGKLGHIASLAVLGFCGMVGLRDWKPTPVVVGASVLIALPAFAHNLTLVNANAVFISLWLATILYSYALGARRSWLASIIGIAALIVGINLSVRPFNPVPEMLILGPWAAGLLIASRQDASRQLAQRAQELDQERETYAAESVRYERARIARELHDIVAHCVSLMVVQASAGEKLTNTDPVRAAASFTSIIEAARQASNEIDVLVSLLADAPVIRLADLRIISELVIRAQTTGLSITCHLDGDLDGLSQTGADTAYRLVQEAITNAMKHAPGSAIHVTLRGQRDTVQVQVVNDPPRVRRSGLEHAGGGHGLTGMRERVADCGGTLITAATSGGGWDVTAAFPRANSVPDHDSRPPPPLPGPELAGRPR
jgi:signal transduction histidine kinase